LGVQMGDGREGKREAVRPAGDGRRESKPEAVRRTGDGRANLRR
jgi:hypothetical protein